MKILTWSLPLIAVLALASCDRRATQAPEESTTADTQVAATPAPTAQAPAETDVSVPPPIVTESCDDLTGQAQTDCLERNRINATPATPRPQDVDGTPTPAPMP